MSLTKTNNIGWRNSITIPMKSGGRISVTGCSVNQSPRLLRNTIPLVEKPLKSHFVFGENLRARKQERSNSRLKSFVRTVFCMFVWQCCNPVSNFSSVQSIIKAYFFFFIHTCTSPMRVQWAQLQ